MRESRTMRRMMDMLAALGALAFPLRPALLAAEVEPEPSITRVYRAIGGDSLHAYIFLPPNPGKNDTTNAVLLFHGGGWSGGSPEWTFPAAQRFAASGLLAVAVEYRLSTGDITPIDALDDVCAAVAWMRASAAELGVTGRVAGYGVSAGGHLVAATATVGCPGDSAAVDALLLWSPALDVVGDRWFAQLLQRRANAVDLSPAHHVGPGTPPTSIVHGEKDTLTPLSGVQRYCAALAAQGDRCDLHVYPGVGHLLTRNLENQESDFDPDPAARADGIAQQLEFLRRLGFVSQPAAAPVSEPAPLHQAIVIDLLARFSGEEMYGAYYERNHFVVGFGVGLDIEADTPGFAAERVTLDLVGVGMQLRHYGSGRNRGPFGGVALGYVHGSGAGTGAGGRSIDYTYDAYEVSLLGLGYRVLLLRHVALEAGISFRQSLGWLRSGADDSGAFGSYGFVVSGGAGVAF